MNQQTLDKRDDMTERKAEPWRPPVFSQQNSVGTAIVAILRRFLDLQAASIWQDLKQLLPSCYGTVLDVGCGAQPYRQLLPSSVKYIGIDQDQADSQFGYQIPDTIYFSGDTWPIESATIDTVIATETLEHVLRPHEFLAEARRVLKPGGGLLLTVPFAARWHYIPFDYWRFTPSGLNSLLVEAGFQVPVVYARGNELTVACYKVMALILMLLLGSFQHTSLRIFARFTGIFFLPLLLCLAVLGQLSLRSRGGNDCLGYTVVATTALTMTSTDGEAILD